MHLIAIIFGLVVLCYGAFGLFVAGMMILDLQPSDIPLEYALGRWAPYVTVALFLTLPVGLLAGGGTLCRWGFGGG